MKKDNSWKLERIANRKNRKQAFIERFYLRNFTPHFNFTNLPPTKRLEFEVLDEVNYLQIYELFGGDSNPYVIDDYKDLDKLEEYIDHQLYLNKNSTKKGACDWFVKLKETKETIGILNIHELSRETFNDNHKKCFIGYSISEKFRRQHYATEAVENLIHYAFTHFGMNKIVANVEKGNIASVELLLKFGFIDKTENYYFKDQDDYYELYK